MIKSSIAAVLAVAIVAAGMSSAQQPGLANVTAVRCSFAALATGSLRTEPVKPEVKTANLVLEFESINTDEGTAQLKSAVGKFDIIVRHTKDYLHFIQAYFDGPLHVTTILDRKTASGKWKAMHSRHGYMDFAMTGYTSSPEQYYGECEAR